MTEWRLNCYDGKAYTLPSPVAWRLDYGLGSPCDSFWVKTLWSVGQEETLAAGTRMQVFHDGALCFVGVVDECEVRWSDEGCVAVLSAGSLSVDVLAQAVEAGPSGNTAAGLIRTMSVAPAGIAACTNPAAFTGGREEEEDEAFRARILATYRQLPNGTNAAAYAQQTLAVEGVCAVNVLPKKRGLGTVDVVITSAGGVPGTALVEQVQGVLEEQREIAVDVKVMAPETVTVDLILSVKPKEGLLPGPVIDRVKAALRAWFDGSLLGQDVLLAQIGQKIFAVDGVANYQIQGPVNDVTVGRGQLPVLGKLSVEELR